MSSSHRWWLTGAYCPPHRSRSPASVRRLTALLGTAAALAGTAVLAPATGSAASPAPSRSYVAGAFYRNLLGVSLFRQSGTSVTVSGRYLLLPANGSFFTVAYANSVCDPAQAFPVGPFTTDRRGRGTLNRTVTAPTGPDGKTINVGQSTSVSVRIGDTNADLDGDGLVGPSDVVAVAGKPAIGLVECDSRPIASG